MKRVFFTAYFGMCFSVLIFGEVFQFSHIPGEKYKILSTVQEEVYINDVFSHQAEILNKIAVEVEKVNQGAGLLWCTFQTSEESRSAYRVFTWGRTYESEFWRDEVGNMTIEDKYFMPIVRNVPLFPRRNLEVGETWTAPGEEVHDFRDSFGVSEPLRFPIYPRYTYQGIQEVDGKTLHVIEIEYTIYHRFKPPLAARIYPTRLSGRSSQVLFWDQEKGRPDSYREEFDFVFEISGGDQVEYVGKAEARVIESPTMDREKMVETITQDLSKLDIQDTGVKSDELGVTLTLENIQFLPDSAVLIQSEQEKLKRIGEILKKYPDRDILITGHTALAGTTAGRKQLSEERAAAVGDFLLELGVRGRDQLITRGMGAEVPVADNSTEEGRRKNRRVEITLLEN